MSHAAGGRTRTLRTAIGYAATIGIGITLFLLIRAAGESAFVGDYGSAATPVASPSSTDNPLLHVLLALATVIVVGRGLGGALALLGQPRVIGEVIAGIALGPSLLGRMAPEAMEFLLAPSVSTHLGVIAQLGVVLYMFLVGLQLNLGRLRSHAPATVAISHTSIVLPFVLGAALSLWLYRDFAPEGVRFTSFALFIGIAMSITAFPVLARILADRNMEKTDLGVLALSCAATDDVTAWCLLAFVVGVTRSEIGGAIWTAGLTIAYIGFMFAVARPLANRFFATVAMRQPSAPTWTMVAVLLSAVATEAIGVHAVFGAFLLGAVIPHDSPISGELVKQLESVVNVLLLPAFFAYIGLRTQIGLVQGLDQWMVCGAIIAVATAGKFLGTLGAARATGLTWRDSASLGVLMNTRGLMELIVLNIGLDLGVLSPTLFAMLVMMALATTLITSPLLRCLQPELGAAPTPAG